MLVFLELIALEMENFLVNGIFATFFIFSLYSHLFSNKITLSYNKKNVNYHLSKKKKCKLPIWLVSLSEESEIWLKLIEFTYMMLDHIP